MTNETGVESTFLAMLAAAEALAGIPVHHADDNTPTTEGEETAIESIAVKATKGDNLLDGAGGSTFSVSVEFKSTRLTSDLSEKMKAIEDAIEQPTEEQRAAATAAATEAEIQYFQIEPQAASDREADGAVRTKTRTWTVIAA